MKSFFLLQQFACLIALLLIASSCEIETQKDKYEDRILGTWEFEEVKKLKLFDNETVTDDYEETLLEFLQDGTLNILDKDALTVLATGTWDMDDETRSDGETTTTYVSLETNFDVNYNGVDYSFDESTITRFKNGELCFKENKFSKNKSVELKQF
jgi:hypothetical protein